MRKQSLKTVINKHMKEHSSIYVFITVLFLMGVVFGAILVNTLNVEQKQDLFFYLQRFFGQVVAGEVIGQNEIFIESFLQNLKYIALMWLLGISIVGLPIVMILLFLKGMVVGFTIGFLVNQMGFSGFMLSFASIMPQNFFIIPIYIVMGTVAISFALQMVKHQFQRRIHEPFATIFMRYCFLLLLLSISILPASALEAYISPILMRQLLELVPNSTGI
ncbi:stage II sporulation protein M [Bacillus sp. HMF5848]|uniref:stage II sporulation protein M n=1 Tax=Bacillus sp. HMF5848 TaxID=2495421 RepID=UPI000F7731C9|nr:stage II sporulation protein M [Bacillus sp. HMF5848]RSK27716.1 stage II sporulation protein M [Bacillus sp. HMF5848]